MNSRGEKGRKVNTAKEADTEDGRMGGWDCEDTERHGEAKGRML